MTQSTKTTKTSKAKAAEVPKAQDATPAAPAATSEAAQTAASEQATGLALITLYEGTKRLKAQPLTRGEYIQYRGWSTAEGEDPNDPGYLVEYTDGGKPNDPRHEGYISWSPKDVFEQSYKEVVAQHLPPHQQRVVQEVAELTDRASKLDHFLNHNPTYRTLSLDEQGRMSRQLILMKQLQAVLNERVAAF